MNNCFLNLYSELSEEKEPVKEELTVESAISILENFEVSESLGLESFSDKKFDIEKLKDAILKVLKAIRDKIKELLSKIGLVKVPGQKDGFTVDAEGFGMVKQTISYIRQLGPESSSVLRQITKAMKDGDFEIPTPVLDSLQDRIFPKMENLKEKPSKKTIRIDKKELDKILSDDCETIKRTILENFDSAIAAVEVELSKLNSKIIKTRWTKRDILIYSQFTSKASKYLEEYKSTINKYESLAVSICIPFRKDKQ